MSQNEVSLLCPCICLSDMRSLLMGICQGYGCMSNFWIFFCLYILGNEAPDLWGFIWGELHNVSFKYVCDCMTYDVGLWSLWICVSCVYVWASVGVDIPSVRSLICWVVYFQECKVSDLFVGVYLVCESVFLGVCRGLFVCIFPRLWGSGSVSGCMSQSKSLICLSIEVSVCKVSDLFMTISRVWILSSLMVIPRWDVWCCVCGFLSWNFRYSLFLQYPRMWCLLFHCVWVPVVRSWSVLWVYWSEWKIRVMFVSVCPRAWGHSFVCACRSQDLRSSCHYNIITSMRYLSWVYAKNVSPLICLWVE